MDKKCVLKTNAVFRSVIFNLLQNSEAMSYGHTLQFSPAVYDVHHSNNETDEEDTEEYSKYNYYVL